jgi:membrane-bound lytic murein transglycosylase D
LRQEDGERRNLYAHSGSCGLNSHYTARSIRRVSLRLPFLFLLFALLPFAVLTQAPFAKPVASLEQGSSIVFDSTFFETRTSANVAGDFAIVVCKQQDAFVVPLNGFGDHSVAVEFGSNEAESQVAFFTLRALPDQREYAEWLAEGPNESVRETPVAVAPIPSVAFILPPPEPPSAPGTKAIDAIPMYDLWVGFLRNQPRPKRADEFLPKLKRIFAEEGMPEELAWLPEIESMFDPRARNRIGARGLFQFMPGTALEQGLRLRPYDERTHPEKSARAAAVLLRRLHGVFDSWPLALAAYNAGENRVRRTLKAGDATTFAEIADALPVETRLYVPKVLATLAVREGLDPAMLAAPSLR